MTDSIVWGPEIQVNGKRPEWLTDQDTFAWYGSSYRGKSHDWDGVGTIRLPADHPHYRQPSAPERDPASWNRMEALVRRMVNETPEHLEGAWVREARAIIKDIASDELREAREVCAQAAIRAGQKDQADEYRNGRWDNGYTMDVAKLALRRGRELSRQGNAA